MRKKLCIFLLRCFFVFLVLEGLSSTVLVVSKAIRHPENSIAFSHHAGYDKDLGWVNLPNFYEKDFYDSGVYVRTNAAGFRSDGEFAGEIPPGKLRIICSGDSFTFGTGVDNQHTWCQQLTAIDPRMETINMGEPGYGVDQTYLRYRRDGMRLNHDVHIFAVIAEDFRRMKLTDFSGYAKPVLKIDNGELIAGNVPVPRPSGWARWLITGSEFAFQLRLMQLMQSSLGKVLPRASNAPIPAQRAVVEKILEVLQETNKRKNSEFILVYLPVAQDYSATGSSLSWRSVLRDLAAERGVTFMDLVEDLRKVPKARAETFFIPTDFQRYLSTAGHYSDYGNEFVARALYARLTALAEVSNRLASLSLSSVPRSDRQDGNRQAPKKSK